MFVSGDSQEDTDGASSYHYSFFFFSDGFKSSFVDHTFFLVSMLSHAGAPCNHPLLAIQLFRSAQDISKIRVSTLLSFHSTGAFSLLNRSTVYLLSGP